MKDRIPTKPNRYAVYDDSHNFIRYEYHERADEPTQVGDALNRANLLPDAVATVLGLTGNAQVKDALGKLSGAALRKSENGVNSLIDMSGNTFPMQYTKIMEITTTSVSSGVVIDFTGIDTAQFAEIIVYSFLRRHSGDGSLKFGITLNNDTGTTYQYRSISSGSSMSSSATIGAVTARGSTYGSSGCFHLLVPPIISGKISNYFATTMCSTSTSTVEFGLGFRDTNVPITKIKYTASTSDLAIDSKFIVCGVRK